MVDINKLSAKAEDNVKLRPTLETIYKNGAVPRGRFAELYNMFYAQGPGNGMMLSLPFDQLVEHGVGHMMNWEHSADPRKVIELANRANFSSIAIHIGQAEKYQHLIRPDLPLLVKVDGHPIVGKEVNNARHSTISSIHRAVQAGANAIGFTLYIGGEDMQDDLERAALITETAHELGKPVFMWAYARGPFADKMGTDSLFWCAQGIAIGESLGVDVIKQKIPMPVKANKIEAYKQALGKDGYFGSKMPHAQQLLDLEPQGEMTYDLHVKRLAFLAAVAPNSLKIMSGGSKAADPEKELLDSTKMVLDSGNEGRIVGRNLWGIPVDEAVDLVDKMVDLMRQEQYNRKLTEPRFTNNYDNA